MKSIAVWLTGLQLAPQQVPFDLFTNVNEFQYQGEVSLHTVKF